MIHGARLLAAALPVLAAGACRSMEAPPEVQGGWEIAARYYEWSSARVRPPHVVGQALSVRLEGGRMTGSIAGLLANIRLEPGGATGMIGSRPVELDVSQNDGRIEVEGTWYGATVRLLATDDDIRATIFAPRFGGCCAEYTLQRVQAGAPAGYNVFRDTRWFQPYPPSLEIPQVLLGWYSTPEVALLVLALLFSAA